jgi:hypothetical protein
MSLREALGQARLLTVAVLAGMGWVVLSAGRVLDNITYWNPAEVGQTAGAGVVGLLVLATLLVLSLALFSGLGADEPAPETWPPEGDDAA